MWYLIAEVIFDAGGRYCMGVLWLLGRKRAEEDGSVDILRREAVGKRLADGSQMPLAGFVISADWRIETTFAQYFRHWQDICRLQ
jgi:hypothetical protein